MPTYQDYQQQIVELKHLAEAARDRELAEAKTKIFAIMEEFDITLADLKTSQVAPRKAHPPAPVKYRNTLTGDTWSGRGRTPRWLEGQQKEQFLVN